MRVPWLLLAAALLALAPASAAAPAEPGITTHPGYVELGPGSIFDRQELKVHLSISKAMLELVAAAAAENEPELAAMIAGLEGIEVRVFEVAPETEPAVSRTIRDTARRLRRQGWDAAIDLRLEDNQGFLYFRFGDDRRRPVGLAGMFVEDGGEAVFVNIVGEIDPALVGRLAARFNLSLLGDALPPPPPPSDPQR
ncbi:MAG: DUF4252 domain-containing protein [Acidobacteria bacterium]|nr:MAG: DUF4252 domain-containing protein [Acidobacteriota bacterium]